MTNEPQPQPRRVLYPLNRHVVLLLVSVACFVLAAITVQVGHALWLATWAWAFAGAAAYVASSLP